MRDARPVAAAFVAALFTSAGAASFATTAAAGTWPDVEERIARDLDSPDLRTRQAAAHDLTKLHGAGAGPVVLDALDDADPEVKLAGADAAIRLRVAGATEAVLPWLADRDVRVRVAACSVARALPDAKATAPLGRALADGDPQVRAAAAEALGAQANDPTATPPLLGRLDDSTPAVRIAVVHALARSNDARAVAPLIGKIQDSTVDVRQAVVRALGEIGDPRAVQALILALRDANAQVRVGALDALGRIRGGAEPVAAMAALLDDRDPSVRQSAARALGNKAKSAESAADAIRALEAALANEDVTTPTETPVRAALVSAGEAAVPSLLALLDRSPSPRAMGGAAWVLGAEKQRAAAPKIVAALRRGALAPTTALHALAGVGAGVGAPGTDDTLVPVVLEFVADPNPAVRDEALGAAAVLLDPRHPDGRAVEPLAAMLRDPRASADAATRAKVLRLLGRTGATRAVSIVAAYAQANEANPDAEHESTLAAVDALGTLARGQMSDAASARAVDDALVACVFDVRPDVRLHAAVALAEGGGERAREALLGAMKRGQEVDVSAVTTALAGILARRPTDAATAAVVRALDLAGGADRDALIAVLGRIATPAAIAETARRARLESDDDRRAVAMILPAEGAAGASAARSLLADRDPRVRAQAAWALGTLRDAGSIDALERAAHDADGAVSANAIAALGRIFAAANRTADAAKTFCPFAQMSTAATPYVRANAFAALALAKARCHDGATERDALANDPNDDVRLAAARAIVAAPIASTGTGKPDVRALDRCAAEDSSPRVAAICTAPASDAKSEAPRSVTVFVVPASRDRPEAIAPYVLALPDGTYRVGIADRRGALVEPAAPSGELSLRPPSP